MIDKRIVVNTTDGPMSTLVWHREGEGPFPVVVCYHHGPGLGDEIYSTAQRFAQEGYYAAVPDLYHRFGEMISFDIVELMKGPDAAETQRLFATVDATTPELMAADTAALVDALGDDPAAAPGPMGCIGFCHTARAVIQVMADMPDQFVVGAFMHPALAVTDSPDSPHLLVEQIRGELYAGFGGADQIAPLPQQQPLIAELRKLGSNATVEVHTNGGHGFLWPGSPAYDAAGSASAWEKTLELFAGNLGTPVAA